MDREVKEILGPALSRVAREGLNPEDDCAKIALYVYDLERKLEQANEEISVWKVRFREEKRKQGLPWPDSE